MFLQYFTLYTRYIKLFYYHSITVPCIHEYFQKKFLYNEENCTKITKWKVKFTIALYFWTFDSENCESSYVTFHFYLHRFLEVFHFVYRHNNTLCKVKGFGHSTTQKMHKYSWIELSGNYVADAQFQLYMLLDNSW